MAANGSDTRKQLVQGSTVGAAVLLVLALYGMANYLSQRHYKRFDWTSSRLYTLSEKSLAVARDLDRDVDLVLFLNPGSEVYAPTSELLDRYAAANPEHIRKREIDAAKNVLEAQQLVQRFGVERQDVVVIAAGEDRRVIDAADLAEYDYSGAQFGEGPKLEAFKGEQLITSALLELVEARKPKILFTTGHGEPGLEPGGERALSQARDLLGKDNFELEAWGSLGKSEVPAGTDLVVIAGPTSNFLPPELEVFTRYLEAGGRMLVLLDPVLGPGSDQLVDLGLADWLQRYGVTARQDIVIDPQSRLPFFGPETLYTDAYGTGPIVEALQQTRTPVIFPVARSVSRAADARGELEVSELVRTSAEAWGESDLTNLEQVAPDGADVTGPVSLAVAVSFKAGAAAPETSAAPPAAAAAAEEADAAGAEVADADEGVVDEEVLIDEEASAEEPAAGAGDAAPEARLVVFGDSDFAADGQLGNAGNGVLLLNTFNWLVQREQLIDLEARRPEQTRLSLTDAELTNVYLLVLLLQPGLAVVFGVWVWMRRRR